MRCFRWIAALLVALAALPSAGEEAALRYTLDPAGPPFWTRGQPLTAAQNPPPGIKLPRFVSERPLFLTAKLGEGPDAAFTFAVDESEPGAGYDLLFADGNHNRDLTDEKPLRLTRWRYGKGFEPIRVLIQVGGSRVQYHVALVMEDYRTPPAFRLQSWGYYSGEARIGEKSYAVALVDANANGRFADLYRGDEEGEYGDMLLLDANGDGKFDDGGFASPEFLPCARWVPVAGKYYALTVQADGTALTAAPADVKLATLRSDYDDFALRLASEDGILVVRSEKGTARIPFGDYRIASWQIEQRHRDGSLWVAQGSQGRGDGAALPVKSDTLLPRLAAPLLARLNIQPSVGREFECSLGFTAASGEQIANVTRNGEQMPEPRLKIVDARGKVVANLPFHYG